MATGGTPLLPQWMQNLTPRKQMHYATFIYEVPWSALELVSTRSAGRPTGCCSSKGAVVNRINDGSALTLSGPGRAPLPAPLRLHLLASCSSNCSGKRCFVAGGVTAYHTYYGNEPWRPCYPQRYGSRS